ncbi:hypothetical protein ACFXKD_27640 [Nocardiopsis aegyptia]|uniref:hypothetical protein n=1 Tax=Nocardiopsis aegyptia TaxID=220378 RepID=UPI00366F3B93
MAEPTPPGDLLAPYPTPAGVHVVALDRYRDAIADALGLMSGRDWEELIVAVRRIRAVRDLRDRQLTEAESERDTARTNALAEAADLVAEAASGSVYGRSLPGRIRALATAPAANRTDALAAEVRGLHTALRTLSEGIDHRLARVHGHLARHDKAFADAARPDRAPVQSDTLADAAWAPGVEGGDV